VSEDPAAAAFELYQAGRDAMKRGDTDAAVRCLTGSLDVDPSPVPHFKTLELLGEAWLSRGEPRRAIVPLAAATLLNPQVRAPSLLAEAFLAAGDRVRAHRAAIEALSRHAGNKRAIEVADATRAAFDEWTTSNTELSPPESASGDGR
jgi:predicted Zn-dependent protease